MLTTSDYRPYRKENCMSGKKRKGRDHELIELRDKKLAERWHFWTEVKRRRFDDVIRILSREEFFVGEQTIMAVINRKKEYLDQLNNKCKTNQLNLFENEKDEQAGKD